MSLVPEMIEVALAALLHDVGKPYERTGKKSKQLEHLFGYSHAAFTSLFFEDLKKNEGNYIWRGISLDNIQDLASYHHRPSTDEQRLIAIADRCSAGERQVLDEMATAVPKLPYGKSRRPLVSLFSRINLQSAVSQTEQEHWQYPSVLLNRWDESVFPKQTKSVENMVDEEKYEILHDHFFEQICRLKTCPPPLLVDAIMGVCRSCWTFIPSSARSDELPDITLYDHATMSAAIASALFAHSKSQQDNVTLKKKMLLVAGDISGIQDFLLDLPDQAQPGTAKILRARSFYITILTRAAIVIILDRLGLPACNCIKDAGGQFTLLVHNTQETQKELCVLRQLFDDWMLRTFQGRLALVLADPVEIDDSDFLDGQYNVFSERLKVQTDLAKKRKFHSVLQKDAGWNTGESALAIMDTIPPGEFPLDKQLKRLGGMLTSAKCFTLSKKQDINSEHLNSLRFFDILSLTLYDKGQSVPWNDEELLTVLSVNSIEDEQEFGTPYEMTRHVPRLDADDAERLNKRDDQNEDEWKAGFVKPFELIAEASEGVQCLAVLKADVDRLGQIFSRGLDTGSASISRLSMLSRLLNGFFTGFLENRLHSEPAYANVYTEYAGGDDLLFVGPWNVIFRLASDIHETFSRYTCQNEDITLSASIVLGHAKSPIASLVRQAESLLARAKTEGRDRIALFDMTLPWTDFDVAIGDGQFLFDCVQKRIFSQGFLYRLLRYHQMSDRVKKHGSIRDLLWKSQLRYEMARNIPSNNQELRNRLDSMTTLISIDRLKIAATYALYLGR